jgi:hypothetical protein
MRIVCCCPVWGSVPVPIQSRLPSDRTLDPDTIGVVTAACKDAWREVHGRGSIAPHTDLRDKLARLIIAVAERGQRDPTKLRAYAVTFLRVALPHTLEGAPKYRNPANISETWAGRGMRPRWLQAALRDGHKIEEFAITKP